MAKPKKKPTKSAKKPAKSKKPAKAKPKAKPAKPAKPAKKKPAAKKPAAVKKPVAATIKAPPAAVVETEVEDQAPGAPPALPTPSFSFTISN